MTNPEFSNEFDLLYNNINSSDSPGLDEYEKSVFLTSAQEGLVTALYTGAGSYGGFELTEQMRRSLDTLLSDAVLTLGSKTERPVVDGSSLFNLPEDLWYIVYEAVRYDRVDDKDINCPADTKSYPVEVVPVTYDELHRIKGNPFRGPVKRRALRVDKGYDSKKELRQVELISAFPVSKYYVKYLRRPCPIILEELNGDDSINNTQRFSECELHESLHRIILESAVRAAKAAYVGAASS